MYNGFAIELVNSTSGVDISDASLISDGRGFSGLEFTLKNQGAATVVAHGVIVELYRQGLPTPFRLSQTADGWFDRGGLGSEASARYHITLALQSRNAVPLDRVVVGLDYVETAQGHTSGADVGRFRERVQAERQAQRNVTIALRGIVDTNTDTAVLRQHIIDLGQRFRCQAAQTAIVRYLEALDAGGLFRLRQELGVHE